MDLMDYRRKIIANSPHLSSASGAIATFSDGADLPLKSLNVDIEPVQSGSGDPSPTNIRPISGWNAVKVTRSGESALKPSTAFTETQNGLTFTSDGNGTYSVKGTNTATTTVRSAILPVPSFAIPPSSSHTLYINNNAVNSSVFLSFMIGSTSIDSWAFNVLNREASSYGTMGNKLCDGLRIVVAAGQTVDITFSPMLLPKENTDDYNISFSSAGTVYGGTLNPLTGVLTVDTRLLTLSSNGLGNYAYNSSNGQLRITALRAMPNTIVNICSHYKSFSGTFANLPDKSFMASSTTIAVKDTNFTSLSAWLTYLDAQVAANTPVQVRVKLQTAEVIQLTPHQIRSLYGNNTIFADTGNVALEYWAHA